MFKSSSKFIKHSSICFLLLTTFVSCNNRIKKNVIDCNSYLSLIERQWEENHYKNYAFIKKSHFQAFKIYKNCFIGLEEKRILEVFGDPDLLLASKESEEKVLEFKFLVKRTKHQPLISYRLTIHIAKNNLNVTDIQYASMSSY